ncbi:MAG: MFS transporter [Eubacteriales bacterium]|nr:MFS transporter [Eubacteriales bacterium]
MIKRNIYVLYAIGFLQGMVFYAPVATLYRQAAGIGIFQITLIESISLALMIGLEIPWGWMADRIGYRKTMLICCGLYFVSKLVFWKARSFGGFLLERILLSVVCAGLSGVDSSILYLSCGEEDSHRVFSIYQNVSEAGLILAAGAYALWIGEDYRLAGLLTVFSYGAAALLALGLKEVKKPERKEGSGLREAVSILKGQLGNRKILLLVISAALVGQTHQAVTVFLNQLQYTRAGMSGQMISAAYIAVSITGLVGGFSARLCARAGAGTMGKRLLLLSLGCCLLLALSRYPLVSVLAVVGLRGCYSLLQPLYMNLENRLVTTRDRATALSMNAAAEDGIGIFLNLLFGYAADCDVSWAMLLGGGMCLVSLLCYRESRCFAEP